MIRSPIKNLKLKMLDPSPTIDNGQDLELHVEKFQPTLDLLNGANIDFSKFAKNHALRHAKIEIDGGEVHSPTADVLLNGTDPAITEMFCASLELASGQVNSLNWKELSQKELTLYYQKAETMVVPSFRGLDPENIPGVSQTVSDCTQFMGYYDMVTIDQLIVFSKLSEGAELVMSIPISYKIGACIGIIKMAPLLALHLQPGFSIKMLIMFKEHINVKTSYHTLMSSAKIFVYDNRHIIIYTTVASFVGVVGYNGTISH